MTITYGYIPEKQEVKADTKNAAQVKKETVKKTTKTSKEE